jgi:hypothetical protein
MDGWRLVSLLEAIGGSWLDSDRGGSRLGLGFVV